MRDADLHSFALFDTPTNSCWGVFISEESYIPLTFLGKSLII